MGTTLETFLQSHTYVARESTVWGHGTIPLEVTSYLSPAPVPLELVTSVRAVVLDGNEQVLVVRDPGGYHLIPGGRREPGETILQTLQRELQEETGWSVTHVKQIGFKHFRHLGPQPANFFAYPDFLQLIHSARAETYDAELREKDGYELEALFRPMSELAQLSLMASDLAFLQAAIQAQTREPEK